MALTNFSLPFGGIATQNWGATINPLQPHHATAVNTLLYGPAGHQESDEPPVGITSEEYYKNNPYSPPQSHHHQYRSKTNNNNNYLPPPPSSLSSVSSSSQPLIPSPPSSSSSSSTSTLQRTSNHQPQRTDRGQQYNNQRPSNTYLPISSLPPHQQQTIRTYGEESYGQPPTQNVAVQQQQTPPQYYNNDYNSHHQTSRTYQSPLQPHQQQQPPLPPSSSQSINTQPQSVSSSGNYAGNYDASDVNKNIGGGGINQQELSKVTDDEGYPQRPPGFTRVQAGQGSRTQVHAVLDYDADEDDGEYYDQDDDGNPNDKSLPTVTPIQGPIFLKNGTVPVVPLFSYPTINNGTFVQIPIWWTALSVALGLDLRGDIIRGVPCVKRYHQLFCPTAGNSYPIDKIEKFIDDNKALMRRMYGDFEMQTTGGGAGKKRRRSIDEPDPFEIPGANKKLSKSFVKDNFEIEPDSEIGETYFGKLRKKRQGNFRGGSSGGGSGGSSTGNQQGNRRNKNDRSGGPSVGPGSTPGSSTGRVDACESKIEIVTPYWASNSAGKIRAIVNTQHFEQAIHQEICVKVRTGRCSNDCGCEQKYKWHRLLAYDPDNDCKGIFMDWFLFPSCCVCRCSP